MTEFQGKPLALLGRDGDFVLYRGFAADGARVLVLAPGDEHPAPASLARLEHEYELRAELDPAWAVRSRALLRQAGKLLLVLDDPGGELLERRLGQPLAPAVALPLAIALARAVGQVHSRGLIHKDLSPAHVLADQEHVRLLGFGLASRLPKERQAMAPPEIIAGTLPYLAPEQTGRMNRSIDARSDLYALGIIVYRMLTGELPFTAADPMEWIHCHIARRPVPPAERVAGLPAALSAIVMKCLAKTAEERYQTAAGLATDLQRCLAEWEAGGAIAPFAPGADDIPDQLRIPEKLYGREREVAALLAAFDRVVGQGRPELVLVSGYSGAGKSSVVSELHKALVPTRGGFAAGKFDQYTRGIPYATLAQAFQGLIRSLLGKSDADLARWRDELAAALAPNGLLLVNLVPELKLVIGDQPPVPDLPPQDAEYRFRRVVRRFIGVFARPEHPLVLFLDDLQWLDAATLALLADLATHPELRHLLLVGAYRDNEVDAAHPLMRSLDAVRQAGGVVQEIVLAPLAPDDVRQLVADALHCPPEDGAGAAPLARLVFDKTGGNPFFTIQFLTALAEETLLTFDAGRGAWIWDLQRIRAKGYTDNVADLMVGKLARLPPATLDALKPFACLGHAADVATLGLVLGQPPESVDAALREAVRAGLVIRQDDGYAFLHDRVQEAAYALIPAEERAATHLRIGRLLASNLSAEAIAERIFDVAGQFNRGADLVAAPAERERVAELNLMAGRRARTSTAYAAALTYFTTGAGLLAVDGWERRRDLAFALEFHRAECEFLTGELASAEARLAALANRAADTVERATVTCLRADVYATLAQWDRGIAVGGDYLRHLGGEWSQWSLHPSQEDVRREYDRIGSQLALAKRTIEDLIELPLMADPASLATLDVLTKIEAPAYFIEANLYAFAVCRAVNLSLEYGNSDGSCDAYVRLGLLAGERFDDYQAGFRFGEVGRELVERRELKGFRARVYMLLGAHLIPHTRHVRAGRDLLRRAFEIANDDGDFSFAACCCFNLDENLLAAGDPLIEAQREAEHGLDFARKVQFGHVVDATAADLGLVKTLRGLTPRFGSFDDGQFDERRIEAHFAADPNLAVAACWYWVRKLQARFHAGDYASAVDAATRAQQPQAMTYLLFSAADYHFYGALSHAASCDLAASGRQRQQHLASIAAHRKQLGVWAENCPENFENRVALVDAEVARIDGREPEAMRLYEQAIRSARDNGFVHNEALANELAGRFYLGRDLETSGFAHLRNARYGYQRWGALGKVRALEADWPQLAEPERAAASAATIGTAVEQLDVATVVKASQAVSNDIVLERLIGTLMRIALEHAGADRGLLILYEAESFRIAATATTEQGQLQLIVGGGPPSAADLPAAVLHYVARSHETVLLDDAAAPNLFSEDPYLSGKTSRSILCLPLVKQARLVGILYLENNLTPRAFTRKHLAVLELLASQAAISLENAILYAGLCEGREKLAAILGSALDAVISIDAEQRVILFNASAEQTFGFPAGDIIGQSIDRLIPERFRAAHREHVRRFGESGVSRRRMGGVIEVTGLRADGQEFPVDAAISQAEAGGQRLFTVMLRDVTERKRMEAEHQARQAAEAANRAKSEFLANMSHELRSPLNTILGFTRLLERDLALPEPVREDLGLVAKSGEHLLDLIGEVLDMSKLEARRTTLNEVDFDLDFLLDELRDLLLPAAVRQGLRLDFAPRPGVPHHVHGDPVKLRQILINLIGNAIKFTEQGSVTLGVETQGPAAGNDLPRLLFTVADTGRGIAPDELSNLFQPFVQARAGRETKEGTGLGLAISRGFVRLMGGEMRLESAEGRGTTVRFDIPVQAAKERPQREAIAPRRVTGLAPGQPRYRILAVDDHAEARRLLVRLLAPLGFEVREAADGEAAIELWRQWQPQLIWMDLRMPVLDGREAARRIRAAPAGQEPVIIALTASSTEEERQDVLAAGFNDMLRKPFRAADLLAAMERHLGVRFVDQDAAPAAMPLPPLAAPPALPAELRVRLEQAIAALDPEAVDQAIAAVGSVDAPLAQALAACAGDFQYDAILALISKPG